MIAGRPVAPGAFQGRLNRLRRQSADRNPLHDFIVAHQHCDHMHVDLGPETESGYRLVVACDCGTEFKRWVTPDGDGLRFVLLAL